MNSRHWSRREWLEVLAAAGVLAPVVPAMAGQARAVRSFHVCLSPAVIESDPGLLPIVRDAGVSTAWLAGYFYGHQPFADDLLRRTHENLAALRHLRQLGFRQGFLDDDFRLARGPGEIGGFRRLTMRPMQGDTRHTTFQSRELTT